MAYIYEVELETQFEVIFKKTTLEEAIGVTYTNNEIKECFNNGESVTASPSYVKDTDLVYCYRGFWGPWSLLKIREVIREVKKHLKPKQPVELSLSDSAKEHLQPLNFLFKRHGFMYRPKYGHFVEYKIPKTVKAKPKAAPKVLLSEIRTTFVTSIGNLLGDKYNCRISIDYPMTKRIQHSAVKLAQANDISFESIIEYKGYRGNLFRYIERECAADLVDITKQAVRDWWNTCVETDLPSVQRE